VTVPAVQTARLLAALPNDPTGGNVLNFIPTEIGYSGGAWNLQIFRWNSGVMPVELSKDDDIFTAVALGKGTLMVTSTLVRCPVIDFAALPLESENVEEGCRRHPAHRRWRLHRAIPRIDKGC